MLHKVYIGVGSNVERDKHTRAGLLALHKLFGQLTLSNVYESEAIGFSGTPFYNLVVGFDTELSVEQVCHQLKAIELKNGRRPHQKKFAPRTLDLDLLLYDDMVTNEGVELPRAEILHNAFVLLPLSEIAPDVMHPISKQRIAKIWQAFDKTKQNLWKIDFNWRPESL
ncbi:2-amino-4-hydroxy-6-hydroxymethyldihydropteridine diphosphokinase [Aliiglaciecola litoralis]|uniref:2-amino-4-hydroxy-6-hydroxymethyldihydropteridine diphosphokinase n=1 Tax=Aliiglaciecola litoralis TaxID=582857 RepID=A0ABP3WTA9_9ALTE